MTTYHFSLTLAGVSADTAGLEDALFASGCDDALICFYGNAVYLEFDRESPRFSTAVISAIHDIESAGIQAKVHSVDAVWVGISDIAALSALSRQAIALLKDGKRGAGDFPSPVQRLRGTSPLWEWSDVADWLAKQKKIPQELADNAQELATINLALQIRNAHQQDELARYCALLSAGKPLREPIIT
ncbi:helix-turn-helix transcriptional regulator [Pectobacterium brasiliense]|uniref:helix-turn-helix transcriptional regulator n=1 Tax=Pectobacterium brasiliense TaxID=180957 RepID=UPI0004E712F3|nr:hypothetical protein [Pectobacterium brasiliense]KFF65243.1 regulatory protein [Pectobacterium brasiliense]KHT18348.1 regulatory protein [Pectobacterium brasiliense]KHT25269.1 regulatory protein [Pectobacterium brasiliense]MBN3162068.1 hypothetical protein [Pectobacterium brasiliense]